MADKTEDIVVRVKNSEAVRAMQEVYGEADKLQKKLDSIYTNMLTNNNTVSNKDRTTVENMTGYANDAVGEIQKALMNAQVSGNGGDYERLVSEFGPMLTSLNETLKMLKSDRNAYKIEQINNAKTTSSKAFKSDHIYMAGSNNTYGGIKDIGSQIDSFKLSLKDLKSDISNANNTTRRASNNLDIGLRKGTISYNRFQELKSASKNGRSRYAKLSQELNPHSKGLYKQFLDVYKEAVNQRDIAHQKATNPETANAYNSKRYAELDEYVKELDKLNREFETQAKAVREYGKKLTKMNKDLESAQDASDDKSDDFNIGYDPNSFQGMLYNRRYSIARGAVSGVIANVTSSFGSGSQQRLSNFDNVKGTAYSLGGRRADNRVYNALSDYGYKYGYSASEMSSYLNDYTSTTGRTGSLKELGSMAQSWARQSRLVGNDQTTQALQQSAGNANNMSPSQMRSLGKIITNEITNSGMVAKGSQQQEGLTQLYSSLANLGLSQKDEKNLAGFQGLLAKGGSQWQGTQGANNYLALSHAMFNYNDPTSRRLFAGNNPKYSGVDGSARLLEDMQNASKSPTLFKRQMSNYLSTYHGDIENASANLSRATNDQVSTTTIKKAYKLYEKGELSNYKMKSLLNDSSKANKNSDTFENSGTSTIMKNESALADSALKASQAVDDFRKVLAGINHSTGVMSPVVNATGSFIGQIGSQVISSMLASRLEKSKLFGKVTGKFKGTKIGSILFGGGGTKATEESVKASEEAVKAGEEAVKSGSRASHLSGYAESAVTGAKGIISGAGSKLHGLSGLSRGISPASMDLMDSGAKDLLKTGARSFGLLDTLLIGYDAYSSYKGNSKNRGQRMGKALGGDIGATAGGAIGGFFGGPLGMIAGGVLGNAVGGFAGKYIGKGIDWFRAKSKSNSSARKTKKEADEETTTLKGYNKMLDKAQKVIQEAKAIQSGNGSSDNSSSDTDDISGSGDEALKKIAKTVSKKTGVPANLVYAQLALESSHGTSNVAKTDNNFSGIKFANQKGATQGSVSSEGDHYAHFKSIGDFANAYADLLNSSYNLKGVTNAQQFAHALKNGKYGAYYGSSESSYASNLESLAKQYAFGGLRTHATGGFIGNTPTLFGNDVGMESGTEAFIPLNAGHQLSGISNLSALAGYFGKKIVDIEDTGKSTNTTVNPSYNINLTINGGTDDADNLANVVANKVKDMLNRYDSEQASQARQNYYGYENSGLYV